MKGLRVGGASTLEEANRYLEEEYLPVWQAQFTVIAACADDAHRLLGEQHELAATNDYTIRHDTKVLRLCGKISNLECGAPNCVSRRGGMAK